MRLLKFFTGLFIATLIIFSPHQVRAGLGISPAKIINEHLLPGSTAISVLTLSRSEADHVAIVHLDINFSAGSWIFSDKGKEIVWEKNERQLLIPLRIEVPKNASLGTHHGSITITEIISEKEAQYSTQTVLGTSVEIELIIINRPISDFTMTLVRMPLAFSSVSWGYWKIPGSAELILTIENTGNTPTAPTKVQVDIYDQNEKIFVERVEIKKIDQVPPFTTKEIALTVPHNLNSGEYLASIKAFEGYRLTEGGERRVSFSVKPGSINEHYLRLIGEITKSNAPLIGGLIAGLAGFFVWLKKRHSK